MAKKRPAGPAVLTANTLEAGTVVFWTGDAWSPSMADAARAEGSDAQGALAATGRSEEDNNRVVGAYLVVLDPETGAPAALRERRRLAGPSIRIDSAPRAA